MQNTYINKKAIILCFLWGVTILFFVSPDSYTHDLFYRWDTAWFYTCGKAWVEGLKPYVDFADSKGPLLWFIHGIAYIISPYNYLGIFWLSTIAYTIIFYYNFKIAYLFLNDTRLSTIVTILTTLAYFNPWYHFEISAEDWCQPILSITYYHLIKAIYFRDSNNSIVYWASFVLGFALIWTLLIKFSLTLMLGISACYLLYFIIREKINLWIPLASFIAGAMLLSFPFLLYFYSTGLWDAFINEYFINTISTVSTTNPLEEYIHEWLRTVSDAYYTTLVFICISGSILVAKNFKKDKLFLLVAFLGFYSIAIHHNIHRHYLNCCLLFSLFFFICLTKHYKTIIEKTWDKTIKRVVCFILCYTIFANYFFTEGYIIPNLFFTGQSDRQAYYTVAYYMSQIEKPTIIYYRYAERGFGTPIGALPGSRYWSTQTDPTKEMLEIQYLDAISGKSDFIITYATLENDQLFTRHGYIRLYEFSNLALYSKYELKDPPSTFKVNIWDIFLKHNLFSK